MSRTLGVSIYENPRRGVSVTGGPPLDRHRRHEGTPQARAFGRSGIRLFWPFAGKRVAMRRACILTLVAVFGLTFFEGTASATPTAGKVMPYVEIGNGTITSTTNDVTTSVGTVLGTPVHQGTTSGSQMAASPPPPCGSGSGSSVTGTVATTASNGGQLTTSLNGTVCVLAATSSHTRYLVMNTVTVTGGTGEFANATGSAKQVVVITLSPTTFGSQGPFTSFTYGIVRLAG